MQNLLDSVVDKSHTGFRLHRMEVFNWGTFNLKVWKMDVAGQSSLLTGDIGSGKSTLVDAITTLLVPHHRITYNLAAGADGKERSLLSYVRGAYKKQKDELDYSAKPIYLRGENNYSVLLAYFYNEGLAQGCTLAQVFYHRSDRIEKFFLVSEHDLNIVDHFNIMNNEKDIFPLKKRLKGLSHTHVSENFSDYSTRFRRIFGVKSEKAMDLFYQTVSMKTIGKLTDFVRNHMLEKTDVRGRIEELKRNYDNLTKSYEAVQKAKRQLNQLNPLVKEIEEFEGLCLEIKDLQGCLDALPSYFSAIKYKLLIDEIDSLKKELDILSNQLSEIEAELKKLVEIEGDLIFAIRNNREGQRIVEIEKDIERLDALKKERLEKSQRFSELLIALDITAAINEDTFYQSLYRALPLKDDIKAALNDLTEKRDAFKIRLNEIERIINDDLAELESLKKRKTQIPYENLKLREMILRDLELDETEIPFAGELLKVRDNEKSWQGAIERVLRNLGLSLLVPERHYKRISSYVDKTDLKGRLVYFRVPDSMKYSIQRGIAKDSLASKIEIRSDTAFYDWLEHKLIENFDYRCCDSVEQFQREPKAITISGQIKGGRQRHEKDDRRNIFDQRTYILGWSNQEKIKAIANELLRLEEQRKHIENNIKSIEQQKKQQEKKMLALHDIEKFKDYAEINWQKDATEIEMLKQEKNELEKSSDQLQSLKRRLEDVQRDIRDKDGKRKEKERMQGEKEGAIKLHEDDLKECIQITGLLKKEEQEAFFPKIQKFVHTEDVGLKTIDRLQSKVRKEIDELKGKKINTQGKLREGIVSKMQRYKHEYPAETHEVDASIEASKEFKQFFRKISEEDLPRHEERFKRLLKEGTINDIAIFKNQLEVYARDIEDRIRKINKSLKSIEYDSGTYIELMADKEHDVEIKEFQMQLRRCLEGTLGDDDIYNEEQFHRVKAILDRFQGGSDADRKWTDKVTDIRNWFSFSASERYFEDNTEKEFYSDTSGKSGGQKEKLAYTILASALAYQFGLEWKQTISRSFRFVVLDEAFGRGSDESTRYGLELFKRLDLQLLIVTPLQKINIIENYINSVHFVSNQNGDNSLIKHMTIQEYHKEKGKAYLLQGRTDFVQN